MLLVLPAIVVFRYLTGVAPVIPPLNYRRQGRPSKVTLSDAVLRPETVSRLGRGDRWQLKHVVS